MRLSLLLLLALGFLPAQAQEAKATTPAPAAEAAPKPAAKPATAPPAAPKHAAPKPAAPSLPEVSLTFRLDQISLKGSRATHQFLVTQQLDKTEKDVTHEVTFTANPPGIVAIDDYGHMTPLKNGDVTVTATLAGKKAKSPSSVKVKVTDQEVAQNVHFAQEVVPVFTKYGCNGGGCHGKSGGQNNFRLSLFGYEPWNDHDWLVRESRGRRLSPAAPENSLLMMKATGEIPHEGGIRLEKNSADYNTITSWIRQGMEYDPDNESDLKIDRIAVFPSERVCKPGGEQQLAVTAYYSNGSSKDITRLAIFEANQKGMAEVDENGLVSLKSETGTTSIMVRFQEYVDVFRATIPLGGTIRELPETRNFIDEEVFKKLSLLGLPPSPLSDDESFIRRVTIDVTGRLPSPEETREFLASKNPEKRAAKIDQLLDSPDYAAYFAQKWAGILRNKRTKDTYQRGTYAFHDWIRTSLQENKPYNELVTELVTASGEVGRNPAVAWYRSVKDSKEQMADLAQVFLGIRMQCAQCHHHPYEKWSQDDYYSFAAFLSSVGRKKGEQPDEEIIFHKRVAPAMQNPNTKAVLWFSRMLVNRYWKHFFSIALVEPEDDMRVTNPATHPALLDRLASDFAGNGFDLKDLIRKICNSRTYQLSSEPNDHNLTDTQNFSRYYPRRLQAEVLLDALNFVSDSKDKFTNQPDGVRATWLPDDKFNNDSFFLTVFGRPEMDSACECERVADANLAQSLHLINSDTVQSKLSHDGGRAAALAKEVKRPDKDRVTELYTYALARSPNATELKAAETHLSRKRERAANSEDKEITAEKAEREAFEDILWALVNTKEFLFNH
ncbi:MAG: DUF1549 and DUF1553 domain-containing protein [Verrucomicrobiales bacterium]|nr:DUF1549 and DUF1553 domain-containing protein [Verrucomicrobiales bacterium]